MKQILTLALMAIIGLNLSAATAIEKFIGYDKTQAEYEQELKTVKNTYRVYQYTLILETIKNPELLKDYQKLKATALKINGNRPYNLVFLGEMIYIGKFGGEYLATEAKKDKNGYAIFNAYKNGFFKYETNITEIKKHLDACFELLENTQFDEYRVGILINFLKKYQLKMEPNEINGYAKKLKRVVYPNISKSESWKQKVVDIELIIKANE